MLHKFFLGDPAWYEIAGSLGLVISRKPFFEGDDMFSPSVLANLGPCLRRNTSPHRFVGPGENDFAIWCGALGIDISYEPYLYELITTIEYDNRGRTYNRVRKGFSPDFLIHESPLWPEMHVEITGSRRCGAKISRIRHTRAQYSIHTVLLIIGTPEWRRIERDPRELKRFLLRAGRRASSLQNSGSHPISA